MSTFRAISVVTQTLRYRLGQELERVLPGGAEITTHAPEAQDAASRDQPRINLFLFQARPNASFRNSDMPTYEGPQLANRPRVALDLDYLVSFFGPAELTHLMLGATSVALRQNAYLQPDEIRQAIRDHADLAGSDLDAQHPPVRISPVALDLEDLTRFWSGFLQTPYTLSVVYEASPILMDADVDVTAALEVQQPNVRSTPQLAPFLDPVAAIDYAPGAPVPITGRNLGTDDLIAVADRWAPVEAAAAGGLQFSLPDATPAGAVTLRIGRRQGGASSPPTVVPSSNVQSLVVRPAVVRATAARGVRSVEVEIRPAPAAGQRIELVLVALAAPVDGSPLPSARIASPQSINGGVLRFRVPSLPAGQYLASVEVDGATSRLTFVDGRYAEPAVTLR